MSSFFHRFAARLLNLLPAFGASSSPSDPASSSLPSLPSKSSSSSSASSSSSSISSPPSSPRPPPVAVSASLSFASLSFPTENRHRKDAPGGGVGGQQRYAQGGGVGLRGSLRLLIRAWSAALGTEVETGGKADSAALAQAVILGRPGRLTDRFEGGTEPGGARESL